MTVIVFDLDDTLYNELDFVQSGFREVSSLLAKEFKISKQDSYKSMLKKLEKGRGKIFNDVLKEYNIYSKKMVRQCISVYRSHKPTIKMYKNAKECFKILKRFPVYIVTDGNKLVQKNKLKALRLEKKVKFSFITSNYGLVNSKPSPYCFFKICFLENTIPQNVIYIGDDPTKDFVKIKQNGFKTIRVLTGKYKNMKFTKKYEANFTIKSLSEISDKKIEEVIQSNT